MFRNENRETLPFYYGIGAVFVLCGFYGTVYLVDGILPTALTIQDEALLPNSFIAERAMWILKNLTHKGPRITGSHINEIDTVNYLTKEINTIIADTNKDQLIELDVQVVTGTYVLTKKASSEIHFYHKVQNVVVKLHSENKSEYSLLINSHFDSVPTSPGGSDDGINVAAMLETLRVLSKSNNRPRHNIVFLFNGAEENSAPSHGFITQHKWAKGCKVLINLESCGAGGKIILFQTGPEAPWLLNHYAKVPHPYGQVAGEEIFQSGVVPSDTDFGVFRDFGGVVGVDMAFYKNGYRYHTKYDRFDNIPLGSYQHVGDNTLSLVKCLSNAPELIDPTTNKGKAVYFDIFGQFMVHYSQSTALIVNITSIVLSLGVFGYSLRSFQLCKKTFKRKFLFVKHTILTLASVIGGWILAAIFIFILATIVDLTGRTMSWYGRPWLIFGLYVVPVIGFSGSLMFFVKYEYSCLNQKLKIQVHLIRMVWTILLLVGTYYGIRTSFILMIPVLFNSLGFIVVYLLRWQDSVRKWQIIYVTSLIIPSLLIMYQALNIFALFIPITGRIGNDKNPELIISAITFIYTVLVVSPLVALTNSLRKAKYYFFCLALISSTSCGIILSPLGFPYSGSCDTPTPQRHWILHTQRRFHNEKGDIEKNDSGFFFLNLDRNSPLILRHDVDEINNATSVKNDCNKYLFCGLPLSHAKMILIMNHSTWIPAPSPVFSTPLEFRVTDKIFLKPTLVKYTVTTKGSAFNSYYRNNQGAIELVPGGIIMVNASNYLDQLMIGKELEVKLLGIFFRKPSAMLVQ